MGSTVSVLDYLKDVTVEIEKAGKGIKDPVEREKKIQAKLGDMLSPDHPHNRTWVYFADKVKEKTKGK